MSRCPQPGPVHFSGLEDVGWLLWGAWTGGLRGPLQYRKHIRGRWDCWL